MIQLGALRVSLDGARPGNVIACEAIGMQWQPRVMKVLTRQGVKTDQLGPVEAREIAGRAGGAPGCARIVARLAVAPA